MCTFSIKIRNLVNLDERLCFLFENATVIIDILNFAMELAIIFTVFDHL